VAFTIPETDAHSVHNLKMNIIFPQSARTNWIMERRARQLTNRVQICIRRDIIYFALSAASENGMSAGAADASKGNTNYCACALPSVLLKNKFIPLSLFSLPES
jgi:hypothetical protein